MEEMQHNHQPINQNTGWYVIITIVVTLVASALTGFAVYFTQTNTQQSQMTDTNTPNQARQQQELSELRLQIDQLEKEKSSLQQELTVENNSFNTQEKATDNSPVIQAGWSTYQNGEFSLSFQHPNDWDVDDNLNEPWIVRVSETPEWGSASSGFSVQATTISTVEDALEHANNEASKQSLNTVGLPFIVTIDGEKAVAQSQSPHEIVPEGFVYIIPSKKLTLWIASNWNNEDLSLEESIKLHNDILTTFRFTD